MRIDSKVYLVGAGPGDVELLTLKAMRLLEQADVVVYDRLVSEEVMALVGPRCERHYVGKKTCRHTLDQMQINRLLVTLSKRHACVVRLKGGDPFVFGRGGEEALELTRAGVAFEVVPGITSAQACAAYAGIPLTHRGLARGVQVLTGHFNRNAPLHWCSDGLADPDQTLVVYMGLASIETIVHDLISAGRARDTPAAIVENGTTQRQRRILTRLDQLAVDARREQVVAPAMIIIGSVVSLAVKLDWFIPVCEDRQELRHASA